MICPVCGFDPDRDYAALIAIRGRAQRIVGSFCYEHWDPQVKPFLLIEVEEKRGDWSPDQEWKSRLEARDRRSE